MAQYVDIMTDAGFKAVFQDKQVTIKFLNAALAGERQIKDITYLDKEIKPETVENRTIIFDLLCEDVQEARDEGLPEDTIIAALDLPSEIASLVLGEGHPLNGKEN